MIEGVAAEKRIHVAHFLVVAVDLDHSRANADRLGVRIGKEGGMYEIGAVELVDLAVGPDHGDVADVLRKCVVVGFVEGVLVLHVFEEEIGEVDVLELLEIDVLFSQVGGQLAVSSHIAGHDEFLWNFDDFGSSLNIAIQIHPAHLLETTTRKPVRFRPSNTYQRNQIRLRCLLTT